MGEVRRKVKMIKVEMLCDNCRDGYMHPVRDTKTAAGYLHICDACAVEAVYPVRYPYVEVIKK